MRFALLGDHPDGLEMARALAESGRHEVAVYSGPALGREYLARWGLTPEPVGDLEEVLADPAIEAVIVAGSPADRGQQLRRAAQSERPVLCIHPSDETPDAAYEAAMIQRDTGQLLFPLLSEALHPGLRRLAEVAGLSDQLPRRRDGGVTNNDPTAITPSPPHPVIPSSAAPLLIEMERWSNEQVLLDVETPGQKPGLPGWDALRALGGEIVELFSLAPSDELGPDHPVLLSGRFESGSLLQASLLPNQAEARWRLAVLSPTGRAELSFPLGWPGHARLTWTDESGAERQETWDAWNPWSALVAAFEQAVGSRQKAVDSRQKAEGRTAARTQAAAGTETGILAEADLPPRRIDLEASDCLLPTAYCRLSWQDEIRCLELDDAARRSVARGRASTLEYQEATEEAGFKGTMTLVGCGLLWLSLVLLILSIWVPWMGWLIGPVFALFLTLQLLRWVVPPSGDQSPR
jgi:predicted dehydrogenase